MAAKAFSRATEALREYFASTWVLLSQTNDFLARTSLFPHYEQRFREMRGVLQSSKGDNAAVRAVRDEIVEIRKGLRLAGYDLGVGTYELALRGFRNDAAEAEGFRRIVVFVGERGIWYETGQANHIELFERLEGGLSQGRMPTILQKHYLWYRWDRDLLVLSGSATETRDDWESFKAWCEDRENRVRLLSRLKKLR